MGNPRTNRKRKPTFLWQALLIVLPVAVLAIFGFVSLRQDRSLVQREAAEHAQALADELVPRIWAQITAVTNASVSQNPASQVDHSDQVTEAQKRFHWQLKSFQVDRTGNLIFPPPYSAIPTPHPLNPADLNQQQAQLWTKAQTAESQSSDGASAVKFYDDFLAANPPDDFAAIAWYRVGCLLDEQHEPAAAETFGTVLVRFPDALTEAGLPLARLAEFRLLQIARAESNHIGSAWATSPDHLCSNVIYEASFLTPRLLTEMAVYLPGEKIQIWQSLWDNHESARALYGAASPLLSHLAAGVRPSSGQGETGPIFSAALQLFWFTSAQPIQASVSTSKTAQDYWLALRARDELEQAQPRARWGFDPYFTRKNFISDINATEPALDLESSYWYICRAQSEIAAELAAFVKESVHMPEYFGLGVDIAGKRINIAASDLRIWRDVHYNAKGSGERKEVSDQPATTILASATKTEAGSDLLKVNIYLTSPATLYKLQTTRTFWFGSLILCSALAALLGLLAAWRSFQRQLQLSEMKSNFVASVSHELRAPIASVRLMAESLERGKISEPAKQNEYFRFIGQESRRLSSLIENVLDFSRIEQGRKQYEFEPTDLVALAQRTVRIMEPYAAEREIQLVFHAPDAPRLVASKSAEDGSTLHGQLSADGRAIQQALVNLLDNAIKHSHSGQTVTVGLETVFSSDHAASSIQYPSSAPPSPDTRHAPAAPKSDEGGTLITLFVEDSGEGIPAAEHTKIFERFYRLGSELRRETQGVGIGLSIVKHIVEAHGGRVVVRSSPGQGSRFTIELPAQPPNENDE